MASGYCEAHQRPRVDTDRKTAAERGYGAKWQRARAHYIREQFEAGNIFCGECKEPLLNDSDIEVDHKIPHRGNQNLFWDCSNWQLLHGRCHKAKTGRGE